MPAIIAIKLLNMFAHFATQIAKSGIWSDFRHSPRQVDCQRFPRKYNGPLAA